MEKYLNKGVQEVIDEHPEVGEILNDFDIACITCTAGSCLLKDVVGIHNLPADQEVELMYQIEKALYPERDIEKPDPAELEDKEEKELTYSPPVQQLVDEHKVIKRWLALVPDVIDMIDDQPEKVWQWIAEGAEFSSYYADKFHHAKEEDILFKYSEESLEIIEVMHEEHVTGRNHIQAIREAAKDQDKEKAIENLMGYKELLEEHINKEDEILYPWIDRNLTDSQVGELFSKFADADQDTAEDVPEKYIEFVEKVEKELL